MPLKNDHAHVVWPPNSKFQNVTWQYCQSVSLSLSATAPDKFSNCKKVSTIDWRKTFECRSCQGVMIFRTNIGLAYTWGEHVLTKKSSVSLDFRNFSTIFASIWNATAKHTLQRSNFLIKVQSLKISSKVHRSCCVDSWFCISGKSISTHPVPISQPFDIIVAMLLGNKNALRVLGIIPRNTSTQSLFKCTEKIISGFCTLHHSICL